MSTIKRYQVTSDDHEVVLQVDTSVLTPEMAGHINTFLGGHALRLAEQKGNVVETAVRLFGARAIFHALAYGGADFSSGDDGWLTKHVLEQEAEGWPDFENLGIVIVEASVYAVDYYGVTLTEVQS